MRPSYSVLQHLLKPDARVALRQIARVVRPGGNYRIQMAWAVGVRSLQHIARRRFRRPKNFEVSYWLPYALYYEFERIFGDAHLEVDCYFGLGLQPSDYDLYGTPGRMLLSLSEMLRRASRAIAPLKYLADSLYVVGSNLPEPSTAVTSQ